MSQPIIQSFITTADDSGARKISQALKGVSSDMKDAEGASKHLEGGIDNISGKLGYMGERKLGNIVFRDMAMSALGASSSVNSVANASQALTGGLEILGRVALGFSGTIGLAILAVTALVSIMEKIKAASDQTAESIKKNADELMKARDEYKAAAEVLLKHNDITKEQATILKDLSKAKSGEINDLRNGLQLKYADIQAQIKQIENDQKISTFARGRVQDQAQINRLQKEAIEIDKALSGLTDYATKTLKDQNAETVKKINLQAITIEADEKIRVKNMDFIQVIMLKQFHERTLLDLEKQLNATENENAKNVITAQIDGIKKLIEIDNQKTAQMMANAKKLEGEQKALANEIIKGANAIASGWEIQNDKLVFSSAKAAAAIIGLVAQQIETELAMAAAKDFLMGNFAKGAAEAAGVGVVASLAGAAGALLGQGPPSASSVASPSGASSASSGSSSASSQQMTNLTVEIRGGYFDENACDNLAKMLSKRVSQGNIRLVSSNVLTAVGQVPG